MSAGIDAKVDGSAAIQVGGTDFITISAAGAVAIPQSLTIAGQPAGGNYALNAYTAPATWTKPAGLKAIKVTVVGAGGNGGTASNPGAPGLLVGTGGGGGGGAAIDYIPAPSIPGPVAVTAGAGTNSFGAFCSATAGGAGTPGTAQNIDYSGGAGGTGSGGQANFTGTAGGTGRGQGPAAVATSGAGGGSLTGAGGAIAVAYGPSIGTSISGGGYGGGGGGAARGAPGPASTAGGTGTPGIVIVEEFY